MSTIEYVRKLGFTNVQDYINSEAHGTINPSRLKRMVTFMTNNGWVEVPKLDGDFDFEFSPRDLIKYVTNNKPKDGGIRNIININLNETEVAVYGSSANKFRSGGWLISVNEGDDGKYFLYKPHNLMQPPISIQFENISTLYVLSNAVHEEVKNKRPVIYKRPGETTKYPVCMLDSNGETITVYYASEENKRKRFMDTKKFQKALKNGWKFEDQ